MQDHDRRERREAVRRHVRRQRLIGLIIAAGCVSFLLFYFLVIPALRGNDEKQASSGVVGASPSPTAAGGGSSPSSTASAVAAASPTPSPRASETGEPEAVAPPRPHIVQKPIAFGAERRKQMAAYSLKRYGDSSIVLAPKVVVLHYTAGGNWEGAWSLFDSNTPNASGIPNDLPGTSAHFIIDKDGTIYQLLPLDLRGRHTIGLNNVALGIELVEEGSGGSAAAVRNIFHRKAQTDSALALVRWLQYRFDIPTKDVIGHGTANDSRYFKDLEGFKNDHTDWGAAEVRLFQKRLRELDAADSAPQPAKETPGPSPAGDASEASPGAAPTESMAPTPTATSSPAAATGAQDPGRRDPPMRAGFFTPWRAAGAALLLVALVLVGVLLARLGRPRRA